MKLSLGFVPQPNLLFTHPKEKSNFAGGGKNMIKLKLLKGFVFSITFVLIWLGIPVGIRGVGVAPPTIVRINNPSPQTDAHFGSAVEGLGDINGDGVGDFAVGARGAERVYLFSGADNSIIYTIEGPDGVEYPYWFGHAVRGIGDVDGDGIEDLAVGAPYSLVAGLPVPCIAEPCPPMPYGDAFVFSGATGTLLFRAEQVEEEYGVDFDGDGIPEDVSWNRYSSHLGITLAPLRDVNGDDIPDFAAGEGERYLGRGHVYAFSGADGSCLWVTTEPTEGQYVASFGRYIAEIEDLTGDGITDLLVGADSHDYGIGSDSEFHAGRGYILSGSDGTIFRIHDNPVRMEGDRFGRVPRALGDQDGDGVEDYAFGDSGAGVVHLYSGVSGAAITNIASLGGGSDTGFGSSIVEMENMCKDGQDAFWLAAPGEGTIYLMNRIEEITARVDGLNPVLDFPHFFFYYRLSTTQYLDGDGTQDLLIGEPGMPVAEHENVGSVLLALTRPIFSQPDIFDDENATTPLPGGWPIERNDSFSYPTRLVLPLDLMGISTGIHYSNLNLEYAGEQDYFQVTFPEDSGNCACVCGDDMCAKALVVTVICDRPVNVTFLSPDDGLPIHPYLERWERSVGAGTRIIEIACPEEARATGGRRVATEDRKANFYIDGTSGVSCATDYDLSVGYRYLPHDHCELPFQTEWHVMGFIDRRIEEPVYNIFPGLKSFLDCEANPACDPPEEYIAVDWIGGDLNLKFDHFSLSEEDTFTISLLNAQGDVLGTTIPMQPDGANIIAKHQQEHGAYISEDSNVQGQLLLMVKDLPKAWYFLQIDGSSPTLFSYHFTETDIPLDDIFAYELNLVQGSNLISVPLNPGTKWFLSDLAKFIGEELSFIVWHDKNANRFISYFPDFPLDSPANKEVLGEDGYIVFMRAAKTVTFTGIAWSNTTVPLAPSLSQGEQVLILDGFMLEDGTDEPLENIKVILTNLRTSQKVHGITGEFGIPGRYTIAFADTTGRNIAKSGDIVMLSILDADDQPMISPITHQINQDELESGLLNIDRLQMPLSPMKTELLANYPNPFNPETWLPYQLAKDTHVAIKVYDTKGQLVRRLDLGRQRAGTYLSRDRAAYWDGKNSFGEKVASGVYFYQIQTGSFSAVRKMAILK